ncbi:MAG: DUF948 domain-containing protein [Eubacteriaceae bacterium]|jgi:uncharacterized protein YoxC|nr:DUF948 domain-containing protein [Eubacteriaceae bacterium]
MFANANLWEVGVLIIGLCFIPLTFYLVKTLMRLIELLNGANQTLVENRYNINSIIKNAENMTKSSDEIVNKVNGLTNNVVRAVDPIITAGSRLTRGKKTKVKRKII